MNTEPKTGYIALLDILGFSDLIARDTQSEELQRYFDAIEVASAKGTAEVEYVLFSDTIVMSTPSDTEDALLSLVRACSQAMHYLLKEGLPVRGAISHGAYFRSQSPKGLLIAGPAFLDAYRFEKAQDWVGIAVATSVLRFLPKLKALCIFPISVPTTPDELTAIRARLPWVRMVQPNHGIPWHTTDPFGPSTMDGYAVVPTGPEWKASDMVDGLTRVQGYLDNQRLLAGASLAASSRNYRASRQATHTRLYFSEQLASR